MDETFDPYLKWLGIRSQERPPNHYALLGLSLFEGDPEVISNAADRQMSHVRTYQVGPHSQWSQRLLNELAGAKLCLLRADRKAPYDAQLGELFAEAEAEAAAQIAAAQGNSAPLAEPFAAEQMPVAIPVATPVELPFTTNFIEPPIDYAAPPQSAAPDSWYVPAPSSIADESGALIGQTSGSFEYPAPAVDAYADSVGWTEPIAYEPAYAVDAPAYGDAQDEPPFAAVGGASDAYHDGLAVFTAAPSTSASARARMTRRRSSSPMGFYVVLAGLLLAAVVLGKVVSDQRQVYDQEVAAQRAQEDAQRAAAAAKPPSQNKWKRPPNRSRSVDARLPRPTSQTPTHEDRRPLREAGEPTSYDDSLLNEAERDQRQP
jgi:hypothetical protein